VTTSIYIPPVKKKKKVTINQRKKLKITLNSFKIKELNRSSSKKKKKKKKKKEERRRRWRLIFEKKKYIYGFLLSFEAN
jgi:hypothetical protein